MSTVIIIVDINTNFFAYSINNIVQTRRNRIITAYFTEHYTRNRGGGVIFLISLAGTPATTVFSGTELITQAPAPTIALAPILATFPLTIVAPKPMNTLSAILENAPTKTFAAI
jgi:hypothetical protein